MNQTSNIKHHTSEKPRFSIIVPLYNKAPYVRKALDSVISQTCTDWECIIVDDGSTDNSAAICEEYLNNITHQTSHIIHQKNSGVAAARNNGVKASCGEYVCFLDADDWWEPTFLEEMDRLITDYPDAGIYAMNYIYYKPGKTHIAITKNKTGYINYPKAYLENGAMMIFTSSSSSMPRKVFDEMGGFPLGVKLGEDFLLWAKTTVHYPAAFCEKPLAYYNNDVPASLRATRNIHAPEYHMLFLLGPLEKEIAQLQDTSLKDDWKRLLDTLRIGGLKDYWLSDEYHDIAVPELAKIDWSRQPRSAKAQYEKPIWFLRAQRRFMQIGSYLKQKMIRLHYK